MTPTGPAVHGTGHPDTRGALLAAALVELRERGHAGVSLRAVARRAGVSHAAPKHHFVDRAGLLTAVATRGFLDLAAALDGVHDADAQHRLGALGRTYVDFGLSHPALFDLMFRPSELDADDPDLLTAQEISLSALTATADEVNAGDVPAAQVAMLSWALVHGVVVLCRDGALRDPSDPRAPLPPAVARELALSFSRLLTAG